MPAKSRHALQLSAALASVQATLVILATRAAAAPTPSPSPSGNGNCSLIVGPAKDYCEGGAGTSKSNAPKSTDPALDPLTSLGRGCADAAAWIVGKLSDAVKGTANVDFTNTRFLQQYAIVFAASTVLTLVLWLLAVAKRAIRGVPLTTAISEAIGFLWLTVLASAFTPLILYTIVSATDAVTEVIASSSGGQTDVFFGSFAEALKKDSDIGGGPIMLIVVSLVSILAAGILWLELVIRAALLYVGALLGTAVYAGLVDKNMWGHVRRWAGIMIAVIMVKPVIVIVLGLAGALSSDDGPDAFSAVVSGLAIILLAIFASGMIYRFVPGFGDEIQGARTNRKQATDGSQAAAMISSPAALVSQGIKTHSSRGGGQDNGGGNSGGGRPANPVSGGVAAHSSRNSGSGVGGGSVPSAAPPPRSGSGPTSGTPHSSRGPRRGSGSSGNSSTGGGGR
uniref:Integral membrane protein n=1 Tax=Streptomyces sp. NBC_00008 TaxID=2903610 RepID=A0AAU2VSY0_9ACTN